MVSTAQASASSAPLHDISEKHSIDDMHLVTQKSSQASLASATVIASGSTGARDSDSDNNDTTDRINEKSSLSCPPSAHNSSARNPFDTDIEAMITHTDSSNGKVVNVAHKSTTKTSKSTACGDAQVWPGQSHWKKKAKEQKIQRSRTCLSRLSKRNRLIAKILLGLFVLSIAVGVGLGISKPLGAAIWGQKKN